MYSEVEAHTHIVQLVSACCVVRFGTSNIKVMQMVVESVEEQGLCMDLMVFNNVGIMKDALLNF